MVDDRLGRHNAYLSYITQSQEGAIGLGDHQVLDIADTVAKFRFAPNDHVKYLLLFEQVTNQNSRDECGCCAAYVTGFDAVSSSRCEIYFDLENGLLNREKRTYRLNTFDIYQCFLHFVYFRAQDSLVFTINTHGDIAGWIHNLRLAKCLLGVGAYFTNQPGITIHYSLNARNRCIIIGLRIKGDPQFT